MDIYKLQRILEEIIYPSNFLKNFKNEEEFRNWCRLGTIRELEATLEKYIEAEEYEACLIIKETIDEKRNNI